METAHDLVGNGSLLLLRQNQLRHHCEEQDDEAIQNSPQKGLDCSAALAMTRRVSRCCAP